MVFFLITLKRGNVETFSANCQCNSSQKCWVLSFRGSKRFFSFLITKKPSCCSKNIRWISQKIILSNIRQILLTFYVVIEMAMRVELFERKKNFNLLRRLYWILNKIFFLPNSVISTRFHSFAKFCFKIDQNVVFSNPSLLSLRCRFQFT